MRRFIKQTAASLGALLIASPTLAQTSGAISGQPSANLPLAGTELVLMDQLQNGKWKTVSTPIANLPTPLPGSVTGAMLATNAAAINLGFTPARVINVMDPAYGAVGDGVTDDTAAFAAAIAAVNASAAAGQSACLTIPKGVFYINGATLPSFSQNTGGGVCGAGSWKSVIKLGTSYSGDLFSWSDSWYADVYNAGTSSIILPQKIGARVVGVTILADYTASSQQNALMFYDHNDAVSVHDVDVSNLNGRAIYAGAIKYDTASYLRESRFSNIRISMSGAAGAPAFEITSQCTASCPGQDATNEIDIDTVDIYGSRGPSFVLRNANPANGGAMRQIRMSKVRIEGTEGNTYGVTADLMNIGDGAMSGPMANIRCDACELMSPYTNYAALNINGATKATAPSAIGFSGIIAMGAGGGYGLKINAGSNLMFDFATMSSAQTNVTVASSATTAGPIIFEGHGSEVYWTWSVDATAIQYVSTPRWLFGVSSNGSTSQFMSAQRPDGTVSFGNSRGMGSTDWQTQRWAAGQVASGLNAVISGGAANQASGQESVVAGGNNNANSGYRGSLGGGYGNIVAGDYSTIPGGINGWTYGNTGMMALSSGVFVNPGEAQLMWGVARAATSSTSAARLTADGSGVANGQNIWSLPDNYAMAFDLTCTYRDTTNAKAQSWKWLGVLISRGSGAATTAVAAPAATNGQNIGSPGATPPTLSADTTNGGLNITFTAPNSDASHIVCGMSGVVAG